MANKVFEVNLREGIVPFGLQIQPDIDTYGNTGAYVPTLKVLHGNNAYATPLGIHSSFGSGQLLPQSPLQEQIQEMRLWTLQSGIVVAIAVGPTGAWLANLASADIATLTELTVEEYPTMPKHTLKAFEITPAAAGFDWIKIASAPMGPIHPTAWWTFAKVANNLYLYQQGLGYILAISHDRHRTSNAVRIYQLNPTYIIGTAPVYKFVVHTNITATKDKLVSEIVFTLAPFDLEIFMPYIHKTHYAAAYEATLSDLIKTLFGAGVISV